VSIASPSWLSGELPCRILEAVYHNPLPNAIDRAHIPPGGSFYPDSRIHQHRMSVSYHCSLLRRPSELLFQLVHIIPYKFPHIRSSWLCIPISSRCPIHPSRNLLSICVPPNSEGSWSFSPCRTSCIFLWTRRTARWKVELARSYR
jgi:hypothetical protein